MLGQQCIFYFKIFLFYFIFFNLINMEAFPACMNVCTWCPRMSEKGIGFHDTGVRGIGEPLVGAEYRTWDPLQE